MHEHVGLQKFEVKKLQLNHCLRTVVALLLLYPSCMQTNCGFGAGFMSTMNNLIREQLTLHIVITWWCSDRWAILGSSNATNFICIKIFYVRSMQTPTELIVYSSIIATVDAL